MWRRSSEAQELEVGRPVVGTGEALVGQGFSNGNGALNSLALGFGASGASSARSCQYRFVLGIVQRSLIGGTWRIPSRQAHAR